MPSVGGLSKSGGMSGGLGFLKHTIFLSLLFVIPTKEESDAYRAGKPGVAGKLPPDSSFVGMTRAGLAF